MDSDALRKDLLVALQRVEKLVRVDLLAQYRADPQLMALTRKRLTEEESSSAEADREAWLQTFAGRAAVLYLLKTLYVRVLEDQGLLYPTRIREGGGFAHFLRLFPRLGYAAYLRRVFDDAARVLPDLFAPTPVEIATPGEAVVRAVWDVWQSAAAGGGPRFDFRGELDTRFIGDLYQDLDPDVKKRYALLQTPLFIEEFILDRTLEPALATFGLDDFRMIDPTCGSGHFLLGAFKRLVRRWRDRLRDEPPEQLEAVRHAIAAVYGADLNEYACALSRFRLLLAVVGETGVTDVSQLCDLHFNVITCDSLIPWERINEQLLPGMADCSWLASYGSEEERERNIAFFKTGFHAVVGNPPYIAVADKKKREDYRHAWPLSASGKYSLSAPMTERFLQMPVAHGFSGIIVANNFAKRSFGRGLIERVLPNVRLDLVVDTSGAYIPGHGTPTLMLFGARENIDPAKHLVRVVVGKRGEPSEPVDPAQGIVWSAIATHLERDGYEDAWIAVRRSVQATFCKHPWSLGNDSTLRIKAIFDVFPRLKHRGAQVGPAAIIIEDDAFIRHYAHALPLRPVVLGEDVRDWRIKRTLARVVYPYEDDGRLQGRSDANIDLWELRTTLFERKTFVGTFRSNNRPWYEFERNRVERLGVGRLRIAIGEKETNSHFVVDTSDAIFIRTAPVLTLPEAGIIAYRDVAAVLNSSSLEFWFKQVCFKRGGDVVGQGRVPGEAWDVYFERNASNVIEAPLPESGKPHRVALVEQIESNVAFRNALDPANVIQSSEPASLRHALQEASLRSDAALEMLVMLQEELDWSVYGDFGLIKDPPLLAPSDVQKLARGHRPFEIALARRKAAGEEETAWFERHGLTATTEIPLRYTGAMRSVLERRLALIESDETAGLLEQPVFKRRWQVENWEKRVRLAAQTWLLDRLEAEVRAEARMLSLDELMMRVGADAKVRSVTALVREPGDATDDEAIARLLAVESIPDNPARLFTSSALGKYLGSQTAFIGPSGEAPRAEAFAPGASVDWKRVWRLQEREDAGEAVSVAVPPPFKREDYDHPNGWRIRGKFNIANERFIVYDELVPHRYAWGGWTIAQRALLSLQAYEESKSRGHDGAPEQPTEERPERCGIQFPLWDKIDELRRTSDPLYDDVRTIAEICGRPCPCDVLAAWRGQKPSRVKRGPAKSPSDPTPSVEVAMPSEINPARLREVLARLRPEGEVGLPIGELETLFLGDRAAMRRALETLREEGEVEPVGKGRGLRYRIAQRTLF